MSVIGISAGQIAPYDGLETEFELRIFNKSTFVTSDGRTILSFRKQPGELYLSVHCTVSGGVISHDGFDLDSTTDALADRKHTSYRLELHRIESGGLFSVVHDRLYVDAAGGNPTTLAALAAFSSATVPVTATTYTAAVIDAMFAALVSMATKATEVIYGAVRLSTPAANAAQPIAVGKNDYASTTNTGIVKLATAPADPLVPIAVGDNDPRLTGASNFELLDDYADLADAVAQIGATPCQLKISSPATVTADVATPATMSIVIEANGAINPNGGVTVTIGAMQDPGHRQVFGGGGSVVFARNAVGFIDTAWYLGLSNATVSTTVMAAIYASLTANKGGLVLWGSRVWTLPGNFGDIPSGSIFEARGNYLDTQGCSFKLSANNTEVFKFGGSTRNVIFRNINLDLSGTTGSVGFKMTAAAPNSSWQIRYENCTVNGGTVGWDIVDGAHAWEILSVILDECWGSGQTIAGFRSNTPNTGVSLKDTIMSPAWNGTAVAYDLTYSGAVKFSGTNTALGRNVSPNSLSQSFVDADVDTGTDTIALPAHGFTPAVSVDTVDAARFFNSGGALPTLSAGTLVATTWYVRVVDANHVTLHPTNTDAFANTNKANITSAAGGGTHTIRLWTAIHTKFLPAAVNTGTGVLTPQQHGCSVVEPVSLENSGGALPTGWVAQRLYYFKPLTVNTGTLHNTAADAAAGTSPVIPSTQGTGVHTLKTLLPITIDRPLTAIRIGGPHSITSIDGVEAEGFPYGLIVEGINDLTKPLVLRNCILQGLIELRSNQVLVLDGGQYPARCLKDLSGVASGVYARNIGVYPGDMGMTTWPAPYEISAFTGSSSLLFDQRPYQNHRFWGFIKHTLNATLAGLFSSLPLVEIYSPNNDQPLLRIGRYSPPVEDGAQYYDIQRNGVGSTGRVGHLKIKSNLFGTNPEQCGIEVEGHIAFAGREINDHVEPAPVTSGTWNVDATKGSVWDISPSGDMTINCANMVDGQWFELHIDTAGVASWDLTFNSGFKSQGVLATGIVNNKVFTIIFRCRAGRFEELGRSIAM